jgi:YVTN family beta-propeller protein
MGFRSLVTVGVIALVGTGSFVTTTVEGQSTPLANFEGAQTSPIRLSPDGTRLFAVNTSNGLLSVFDMTVPEAPTLIREIPVGLEPVSVNPRTNDEAWVVNQLSDSVSIVSVSRGIVIATLQVPDEPMDVVFAGPNQAYVSISRSNAIAVFDADTRAPIDLIPLFGGNPRALAVSPDGRRVYVAFALGGNATTVIRREVAPPPSRPTNPNLPAPPDVARIVSANDPTWSSIVTFRMPDHDVAAISATAQPRVARYYSGVGTINLGLAVSPTTGDIFVANTEARNLVQFEPNLRGHWVDNRITRISRVTAQVTPFDLNPDIDYSILPNPAALSTALAQPTAVVFDPAGEFMYVAAFGTDRVAQVDTSGDVIAFVDVGPPSAAGASADPRNKRGPRGLALTSDGQTLYALNRISNSISVIDARARVVLREIPVGTDRTPSAVRVGRGFLYDAKLSGNGTGSCASCHVDADMDHLAWDLGDPGGEMTTVQQGFQTFSFHPMKGPMTTQTLRGLAGMTPLHWRGEKATFMDFNPAFDGLMGGSQIPSADMLAFAVFANTILFQPNPNQNLDRTLPTLLQGGNAVEGREVFLTVRATRPGTTCNACHRANPGAGTNRRISHPFPVPQPLKIPHLRNVYQKMMYNRFARNSVGGFGMDHEGHVSTMLDFLSGEVFTDYTLEQKRNLAAYMLSFDTGTAPAVGRTITIDANNVDDAAVQQEWSTLQEQARVENIELVVKGTLNDRVLALTYRPLLDDYSIDGVAAVPVTRAQLQSFIRRGDTLSVMGVPSRRLGESAATHLETVRTNQSPSRGH